MAKTTKSPNNGIIATTQNTVTRQQHIYVHTKLLNALSRTVNHAVITLILVVPLVAQGKYMCDTGSSPLNPLASMQSGISGTGIDNDSPGNINNIVDSHGKMAQSGGIGGTGIIGIITGFASICVNGTEIHYTADTPFTMDGSPSTLMELATGQIVVVRAEGFGKALTAKHITIMHAAVGPITHIDINGRITQINPGELIVDGTRVEFDPQSQPTDLSEGMEISIKGYWDGAHIHAQAIQIDPTGHVLGNVEHIVLEGYVHATDEQTLRVNNQNINIRQGVKLPV
ncbi:MAG: hypothetical protein H6937_07320 [Burkholderiales bacterium]|nr:hypothetical protein [Burkholderiales bacterium]MDR4516227.1 DUF5666 domain-containing protein [Nitrosomonas sp.]